MSLQYLKATPQVPDTLDINNNMIYVYGFEVGGTVKKQMEVALTKAEESTGYSVSSTANLRGFTATLELKENNLYIKALKIRVYSKERFQASKELAKYNLKKLKPENKAKVSELMQVIQNAGIKDVPLDKCEYAEWFSGDLYYYYGKPLSYTYTHKLSQARVLTFHKGRLVNDKNITIK